MATTHAPYYLTDTPAGSRSSDDGVSIFSILTPTHSELSDEDTPLLPIKSDWDAEASQPKSRRRSGDDGCGILTGCIVSVFVAVTMLVLTLCAAMSLEGISKDIHSMTKTLQQHFPAVNTTTSSSLRRRIEYFDFPTPLGPVLYPAAFETDHREDSLDESIVDFESEEEYLTWLEHVIDIMEAFESHLDGSQVHGSADFDSAAEYAEEEKYLAWLGHVMEIIETVESQIDGSQIDGSGDFNSEVEYEETPTPEYEEPSEPEPASGGAAETSHGSTLAKRQPGDGQGIGPFNLEKDAFGPGIDLSKPLPGFLNPWDEDGVVRKVWEETVEDEEDGNEDSTLQEEALKDQIPTDEPLAEHAPTVKIQKRAAVRRARRHQKRPFTPVVVPQSDSNRGISGQNVSAPKTSKGGRLIKPQNGKQKDWDGVHESMFEPAQGQKEDGDRGYYSAQKWEPYGEGGIHWKPSRSSRPTRPAHPAHQ